MVMSPQEQKLLDEFLAHLVGVGGIEKDRDAAGLIDRAVARQPNAAYLLVQRALLVQQALEASQAEVARLQAEAPRASGASFLDPNAWGRRGTAAPAASSTSLAPLAPGTLAGAAPGAMRASGPTRGAGGSFLGQAAAMAAGVAGGAFLFQGLNHLMGHGASAHPAASGMTEPKHAEMAAAEPEAVEQVADSAWADEESDVDSGGDFA
jgi:hypothetical protein